MAYQRAAKDPDEPPGKQWSVQAKSSDGTTVTLGKYDTQASAESDLKRIADEGFYQKPKIVAPPDPPPETPGETPTETPEKKASK